jgi:hypothetical protein
MSKQAEPLDAPTGESIPVPSEGKKKVPARGQRKRVLEAAGGDYCIYEIIGAGQKLPQGALVPIPTIPTFKDTTDALKWIRNESGDTLAGKQVMIFRACEILSLTVVQKPTVVIAAKPKKTIDAKAT